MKKPLTVMSAAFLRSCDVANGLRLTLKAAKPFALIAMQQSGLELLDKQRGFEPATQQRGLRFKAFDAVTKAAEAQRAFGRLC
ncbi:hypothetical protein ABQX22_04205 [Xanthomonas sp. WHRI 1810A]|uniref:hypothetical protein n=1 Tax=Xanthomonas sp. WHRI 1810A TaxID=3161565 RepID=UPI0032E8C10A